MERPTRGLGLAALAVLMLGAPAQAAVQADLLTGQAVVAAGTLELHGEAMGAWLQDPSSRPVVRIEAPTLEVQRFRYDAWFEAQRDGQVVYRYDHGERDEPVSYSDATLSVTRLVANAHLYVLGAPDVAFDALMPAGATLHPDAAAAGVGDGGRVAYQDERRPFATVPPDHIIAQGQEIVLEAGGSLRLDIAGLDLRIDSASGRSDLAAGREPVEAGAADLLVEGRSYSQYLITLPEGGRLRVVWDGPAIVTSPTMTLQTDGGLLFQRATGILRTDGVMRNLDEEPLSLPGSVAGTVRQAAPGGEMATQWSLADTATPQAAATGPVAAGTGAVLAAVGAAGVVVAIAAALARTRRRRYAPDESGREAPADDPAAEATPLQRGQALLAGGDAAEALGVLRQHVADRPDDAEGHYTLGVALLRTGRFHDGFRHLEHAVRRDAMFLHMLVTRPETEPVRHHARFETFMRRQARRFHDGQQAGYC